MVVTNSNLALTQQFNTGWVWFYTFMFCYLQNCKGEWFDENGWIRWREKFVMQNLDPLIRSIRSLSMKYVQKVLHPGNIWSKLPTAAPLKIVQKTDNEIL